MKTRVIYRYGGARLIDERVKRNDANDGERNGQKPEGGDQDSAGGAAVQNFDFEENEGFSEGEESAPTDRHDNVLSELGGDNAFPWAGVVGERVIGENAVAGAKHEVVDRDQKAS